MHYLFGKFNIVGGISTIGLVILLELLIFVILYLLYYFLYGLVGGWINPIFQWFGLVMMLLYNAYNRLILIK